MTMSFRAIVAAQALGVGALNAAINASYTWWLWRDLNPVRLFGPKAIAIPRSLGLSSCSTEA